MSNSQNPQQRPSRDYEVLMALIEETPANGQDLASRWKDLEYAFALGQMKGSEIKSAKDRALNLFLGGLEQDLRGLFQILDRGNPEDALLKDARQNLRDATNTILHIALSKGWSRSAYSQDALELIHDLVKARITTAWKFRQLERNTILLTS